MNGYSLFHGTIADMTWLEVEEAARKGAIMLVPVGVIEQHGPHLPLGTDAYGAYLMCSLMKQELLKRDVLSVIAPPYYFGINAATSMFPGSLTVRRETMITVLTELLINYKAHGFHRQFVLNHHGDPEHNDAMFEAIVAARAQAVDAVCLMRPSTERAYKRSSITLPSTAAVSLMASESDETRRARARLNRSELHIHADERETSLIMRWYPGLLRNREAISALPAVIPSLEEFQQAVKAGAWKDLSPLGYIGDPAVASEQNGELYLYEARDFADAIAALLKERE